MKQIPLTQGQFALVDDEDFERLSAYKWHLHIAGYAYRYRSYPMHRDILGPPPPSVQCDHKNGNKLDYRRENLRYATHAQNCCNSRIKGNLTGFKGVKFRTGRPRSWTAEIKSNGRRFHLGTFDTKEEAAHAYDAAARIYHGDFARLNFPESGGAL